MTLTAEARTRLADELDPRLCATDGCLRGCRPGWAVCNTCADELLGGPPPARLRVERLSTTLLGPTPRSAAHPDLAGDLGAAASRDEEARPSEAPDTHGASRAATTVLAAAPPATTDAASCPGCSVVAASPVTASP